MCELDRGGTYVSYEKFKSLNERSYKVPGLLADVGIKIACKGNWEKRIWTFLPVGEPAPAVKLGCCTMNAFVYLFVESVIFLLIPAIVFYIRTTISSFLGKVTTII
ncbi:MAG: hypothetical protein KIT34_00010 [Cyanobacteria bacterium TGS_CYA1]|nr:hypothetical protein [Cyanobacteria bacterium TGS_CYA1]